MLKTLFLLVLSVCLAIAASAGDFPNKLVIAYEDKTQFPYYLGDDGRVPVELPGAAVELVQMLEQEILGLEIELQKYPWKRCLAMLEAGKVDAISLLSHNSEGAEIGQTLTVQRQDADDESPWMGLRRVYFCPISAPMPMTIGKFIGQQ